MAAGSKRGTERPGRDHPFVAQAASRCRSWTTSGPSHRDILTPSGRISRQSCVSCPRLAWSRYVTVPQGPTPPAAAIPYQDPLAQQHYGAPTDASETGVAIRSGQKNACCPRSERSQRWRRSAAPMSGFDHLNRRTSWRRAPGLPRPPHRWPIWPGRAPVCWGF